MTESSQPSLFENESKNVGPVECLGITFENDDARREYFLEKLREKLEDSEFRRIEGFPTGENEAILSLSDPPYYTACPNPFLEEFVRYYGKKYDQKTDNYHAKPFTSDISEGKGGAIYKAHTYHTKVPHEAIARYILHYTQPGDIVLDAFSGCGMTGVAGAFCRNPDSEFKQKLQSENSESNLGLRRTVLVDLSPFATFIGHSMTYPLSKTAFVKQATELVDDIENELESNLYGSNSTNYLIWSQILICSECGHEFLFAEAALSEQGGISSKFNCPSCGVETSKTKCQPKRTTYFDTLLGTLIQQNAYSPKWSMPKNSRAGLHALTESELQSLQKSEDSIHLRLCSNRKDDV